MKTSNQALRLRTCSRVHNTAAIQQLVKGALESTIKLHTNKSTTVDYEIDGQIVEEWDA